MIEHSILIHRFNQTPVLNDCLDSVLAQTPAPEEIIVHDSGSHDGSVTLLDPLTDWRRHTPGDRTRERPSRRQVQQVFMRTRAFNRFWRSHNLSTILPWRAHDLSGGRIRPLLD